jgi:glycosyltransferase 2 family protein
MSEIVGHSRHRAAPAAQPTWRRAVLLCAVAFCGLLVARHIGELRAVLGLVRRAQPLWLSVALGLQLLWFVNQAFVYVALYRFLGLAARARDLLAVVLGSNFVNFVTPSASLGALPLFLDHAGQHGLDAARVTMTGVFRLLFNLLWFSALLVFSLTVLFLTRRAQIYDVVAGAIVLTSGILLLSGLVLAGVRPDILVAVGRRSAAVLNRPWRRLLHRDVLPEERVARTAAQLGRAAAALWENRRALPRPVLHIVLFDLIQMAVLYSAFTAFSGGRPSIDAITLVVGYTIGVLFSVVAITPQGVGVTEIMLIGFFALPLQSSMLAAVGVLAYRGLSFWLPLLVGFVALRWIGGSDATERLAAGR